MAAKKWSSNSKENVLRHVKSYAYSQKNKMAAKKWSSNSKENVLRHVKSYAYSKKNKMAAKKWSSNSKENVLRHHMPTAKKIRWRQRCGRATGRGYRALQ